MKIRLIGMIAAILLLGAFFVIRANRAYENARIAATGNPRIAGVDTPPDLPNGKVAWFLRKYSERYASAQHQMAIEEGADTDLLPKEWPHAKYSADAGAYPAVETYFLGYLRYLGRAREHYPILMDSIARTTALEAKLGSEDSAGAYNERERASTLLADLKSAESKLRAAAASGH